MLPSLQNLLIRTKLALILGFTIFALAGTRAPGLAQLGAFLQPFDAYTAAFAEQSRGLQQVNRARAGVEHKTRQNTGLVDRAAHCARAMRDEAADLHAAVDVFRLADEPHREDVSAAGRFRQKGAGAGARPIERRTFPRSAVGET